MSSLLDRITNDRPKATATVTLAFDPTLGRKLAEVTQRRDQLKAMAAFGSGNGDEAAIAEAEAEVQALTEGLETFTVHMQAIGPARVEELLLANKPTEKQKRAAIALAGGNPNARINWNEDTFPPILLSEVVTRIVSSDPDEEPQEGLSLDEARQLWTAGWSQGDRERLMNAAMALDSASSIVEDLGKD